MTRLEARGVSAGYGGVLAVRDVDLVVPAGAVVALLGTSGAGKTTLLRALSGVLAPSAGEVVLDGHVVSGRTPHELARRGLLHVPARTAVFETLTVRDNLRLGLDLAGRPDGDEERLGEVLPELVPLLDRGAAALSGGERQLLGLGRALLSEPSVLLVDELSLGLAPRVVERVHEVVRTLAGRGVAVLVVEHQSSRVLDLAEVCVVLRSGRVAVVAEPAELRGSGAAGAYLGR